MAVSSGKTAFGQAVFTLSKVGKPEMVLKNEQLTAMQLLQCEGPMLTSYIHAMEAHRFLST